MSETEEYWYALRTFFSQEKKVGAHLDTYNLSWFIPMRSTPVRRRPQEGPAKRFKADRPFVHNLIFIRKPADDDVLKNALLECPYSTRIYCKPDSQEWCAIPGRDILELRIICDQSFTAPHFINAEDIDPKVGREVEVVHGPMKGVHGRLLRKNKKYYILKTLGNGMGVVATVSRWCCQPVEQPDN